MYLRLFSLTLVLAARTLAAPLDDAVALYHNKKHDEARAALEAIVAAEPQNARALYFLGLVTAQRQDAKALEAALPYLEKATRLDAKNPQVLVSYGQICLLHAAKHTSLGSANRGRDALNAALQLDPDNLEARQTLYEFYLQAPWPIGSSGKAHAQLEEIRKRDADRAMVISINTKVKAKQFDEAFKICDEMLAARPDHALALFHYGRTASISGQNLERGLTCLNAYIALAPKTPGSPSLANAWGRIGNIQEKLGRAPEARTAYETVLQLDPTNKPAATALANLSSADHHVVR